MQGPFSSVVDKHVTDPWLRRFLDLECFVLSGMEAKDTICAEMAFMFMERLAGRSSIDYPVGFGASGFWGVARHLFGGGESAQAGESAGT